MEGNRSGPRRPVPKTDRTHSSRFSVAEAEQTAEPLATSNPAEAIRVLGNPIDQGILQSLMVPFAVVVPHVLRDRPSQVQLSQ